jgi:aspartyl/asparaginyl beta-hydroxylase (cupin superfamily)
MGPGAAIYPHVDKQNPSVLRVHLGLRIPEGAQMMIDGEFHT